MASHDSNDPFHRRNRSTPQLIPLQDFSRPPDFEDDDSGTHAQHRRTLSDRGRSLFGNRESVAERNRFSTRYAPIREGSPSPTRRNAGAPRAQLSIPETNIHDSQDGDELSPIDDRLGLQEAIGFAGLSFQGEPTYHTTTAASPPYDQARRPSFRARTESGSSMTLHDSDESQGYFSPDYSDTARLTADIHLQQLSPPGPSTPRAQRQDRSSFQTVHFLTPEAASTSRANDDLPAIEAGLRTPDDGGLRRSSSRIKSLSPSAASPLQRAGTIVRNISQRVVNLSNEPELVERSIKRKSSLKAAAIVEPPPLKPLRLQAHDGASSPRPLTPPDEVPSPKREALPASVLWEKHANPFKGKSLGIFPPDHPLRIKLCDLLVHPVTEPCLFVMIVIQTILLAIDSSRNVYDDPRSKRWGTSWIDYGLLVLFVIYTAEIVVRVIVSGFIINPVEYSTINRRIGIRQAVLQKARSLFTPQRQPSVKRVDTTFGSQQPSILRAFTSTQMHAEPSGGSQQQQRVRLAQRAFLRHSFNRLDFIAVISFWISFVMGLSGIENSRHTYVFRMLSCLRILRLLLLTSGTTVSLAGVPYMWTLCAAAKS